MTCNFPSLNNHVEFVSNLLKCESPNQSSQLTVIERQSGNDMIRDWRQGAAKWAFHVVDYFDVRREVVFFAMTMLDQFLCINLVDDHQFKILAFSCVYLAFQVHVSRKVSAHEIMKLAGNYFTIDEVKSMNSRVMEKTGWDTFVPSPHCFAANFARYIKIPGPLRNYLLEQAKHLLDIAIAHFLFIGYRPSVLSLSSLLWVIEEDPLLSSSGQISGWKANLNLFFGIQIDSSEVNRCKSGFCAVRGSIPEKKLSVDRLIPSRSEKRKLTDPVGSSKRHKLVSDARHKNSTKCSAANIQGNYLLSDLMDELEEYLSNRSFNSP